MIFFFYRYVPVQTLKLSKLRARQIAEPKIRLKYPKKISIATEDSSLTLLKNDLPWTLHPLPPPLPTSKTIKVEVDKAMPWALHPLPPPMKTKNYSDYYWPDSKTRPKYYYRSRPPKPLYHYTNNNYKYKNPKHPANFQPAPEYSKPAVGYKSVVNHNTKPDDSNDHVVDHNTDNDYNKSPVDHNSNNDHKSHLDHSEPDDFHSNMPDDNSFNNHVDFGGPDSYKYIDYKHIDYKHVDYKSPDYKLEYPKYAMDEELHENHDLHDHDDHGDHHDLNDVYHYSHDDHSSARINDSPSSQSQPPPPPPPPAEYVSHITIEPSIQIAAFSETELQGDGSNSVSQGDAKHRSCQCTINGHRHKRNADDDRDGDDGRAGRTVNGTVANANDKNNRTAVPKLKDSNAASSSRNAYVAPRVGHATDVQIIRSHDITDQSMMTDGGAGAANGAGYVQQVRDMYSARPDVRPPSTVDADRGQAAKNNDATTFRDESDKFKVEFGRDINSWDESKSAADKQGRYSQLKPGGSGGGGGTNSGFAEDFGNRPTRDKPDPRGRVYHTVQSKVENSDRGVSFSVQTPFSVSSFTSNARHPEQRQARFRYTGHNTADASPSSTPLLSSFQNEYSQSPLNFEQFGLKSALDDDRPPDDFARDLFDNRRPETATIGRLSSRLQDTFAADRRPNSGFSGRLASHFSRDFGHDDRSRPKTSSKPFRYNAKHGSSQSADDLFDIRSKGSRPSTEDSVLEYFQPVVIDFNSKSKQDDNDFKSFGGGNNNNNNYGGSDKSRYFGKTETSGFSKFKKNQNSDQLRLPGRLHESNENLSRKMLFHPSTFDID